MLWFSLKYTLLIGIRLIHFWNIQGDYGSYNDLRLFSDCRSLKSLKFEAFILQIEGRIADFIDFGEYKKNYYL